jgi:phage shock protein PspC (stress-responsive transcriptional regulator)
MNATSSTSSTSGDGTGSPGTSSGPRRGLGAVSDVRRSRDERVVAGVCGGLARRLDVDPVLVRVLAVVLTVVGGAGLILYLAGWLLLPADGERHSLVGEWFRLDETEPQVRDVGLVVAGLLAVASVVGDGGWGWGGDWITWTVLVVTVPVVLLLWLVRGRGTVAAATGEAPAGPVVPTDTMVLGPTADPEGPLPGAPVDAGPPPAPPASPPERPRPTPREPYTWVPTLLTLSTVAIVLAVLRLTLDPAGPVYVAAALAVVGLALVLCTLSRGGAPLILAGLLLLPVLAVGSLVPTTRSGDQQVAPTSAADVRSDYEHGFGRLELDLADVSDPDALLGRTIDVETGFGETVVVVPDGVAVRVRAHIDAGDLEVLGERDSGIRRTLTVPASGRALTLDVDHGFGRVEVRTR